MIRLGKDEDRLVRTGARMVRVLGKNLGVEGGKEPGLIESIKLFCKYLLNILKI